MVAVAVVAVSLAVLTYHPKIVEELRSPVAVKGWSDNSLLLADGRAVRLPGIKVLPRVSVALTEATRRGVEMGSDGRVYALIRVRHWCGQDPVREHIARVNLSYLIMFLRECETTCQIAAELREREAEKPGGRFSAQGLEITEFLQFRGWCHHADELGGVCAPQAGIRSVLPRSPSASRKSDTPVL